ncbi:hypothetical protein INR49_010288 [Caranx melampygus]|nr:hypothetical protein INR49_010300 [Caranx melampygus]KAG7231825.1 hypothetical protein INR49_010288 [Caranx melampygus]
MEPLPAADCSLRGGAVIGPAGRLQLPPGAAEGAEPGPRSLRRTLPHTEPLMAPRGAAGEDSGETEDRTATTSEGTGVLPVLHTVTPGGAGAKPRSWIRRGSLETLELDHRPEPDHRKGQEVGGHGTVALWESTCGSESSEEAVRL